MMQRDLYAVVRESPDRMIFTKFHNGKEEALKEAEQLARKEQLKFFVLKLVGYFEPDVLPIKREVWE